MKKYILFLLFIQMNSIYANSFNPVHTDTIIVINKNITYKINEDHHNIFVSIETDEKEVSKKLLEEGVTIYFDNKGKKKKKVYVQFPKETKRLDQRKRTSSPPINTSKNKRPNKEELIKNMPQEAIYVHLDTKREFHTLMNDLDIDISFNFFEHDRIQYNLRIPKNKIKIDQNKDLAKLTIGVLIGRNKSEKSSNQQPGNSQQQRGGGQQGVQIGGNGSSGGGPGRGSSNRGGGQRSPQGGNPQTQAQTFWFKANLIAPKY